MDIRDLKSIHNRQKSLVKFINTTRFKVLIYWIDYQGQLVSYGRLSSRQYLEINTFVTHPWIFVDEESKDRFPANGQKVFFPQSWTERYRGMRRDQIPVGTRIERTNVYITLPMFTLKELCIREIKRRLKHDDDIFSLEIPETLQKEIWNRHPRKRDNQETNNAQINDS